MTDLRSGEVVHRWQLTCLSRVSDHQAAYVGTHLERCSWDGSLLALPLVTWRITADDLRQTHLQASDVLLVDTGTGACTPVELVAGENADIELSSWSETGLLLVHHSRKGEASTLSVLDAQGRIVRQTASPPGEFVLHKNLWSPDGQRAVLRDSGDLWVWDVFGSGQLVHSRLERFYATFHVWSFDSSCLWVQGNGAVLIWALPDKQHLHRRRFGFCAVWGRHDCVACLQKMQDLVSPYRLCIAEVDAELGLQPLPTNPVELRYEWSAASCLSPDGALLALSTTHSGAAPFGVDIVCLGARAVLGHFALPFQPHTLAWSADGARLLVSDRSACQCMLLDFA